MSKCRVCKDPLPSRSKGETCSTFCSNRLRQLKRLNLLHVLEDGEDR